MLNSIKSFFEKQFLSESSQGSDRTDDNKRLEIALAALMVEVIVSDFEKKPEEKTELLKLIKSSFEMDEHEAEDLIKLAEAEHDNSTDYFQFTHLINQHYSAKQKIKLVENLWRIAYSDNVLDQYEEHVIRRIADLLYVSHSDFMATKLRVMGEYDKPQSSVNHHAN